MVTYFNRKDMISFGNYLLSEKRKSRFYELDKDLRQYGNDFIPAEQRLKEVFHVDFENWLHDNKKFI